MRSGWLGLVVLVGACADVPVDENLFPVNQGPGGTGGTGGTGGAGGADGGWTATPGGGNVSGTANPGGGATPGGTGGGTGTGLPCEVETILKDKCQTCHGDPLMSGPMKLMTRADLLAASTAAPGQTVADRTKVRIHDTNNPMPPPARPQLTAAELATLDAYLAAGAPESSETCTAPGGTGGTGGTGGGTGGTTLDWQPPDSDCDEIVEFRAHGGQTRNDTTPFMAPNGGDNYEIFYFVPTWTEKMHTIRIDPIIDNGAVLHHWLLYMEDGNGSGDGTHESHSGLNSGAQLLSGWAPGNKSIPLGREIGMQTIFGKNARFGIEIHYNTNGNPPNRADRSGARLCLTKKLRPKEAGTHWLGTQAIFNLLPLGGMYEAGGRCSVKQESHIIAMSPHMHTQGRHMKSIITKQDGSKVTITDKPFAFDDQQIFPIDNEAGEIVVGPGDIINTTCTFDATRSFTFGPNTDQEMCYNFVVAWPSGSLSNGSDGIVGGKNTCIDPGT